jgi:aryl carrier-like protein
LDNSLEKQYEDYFDLFSRSGWKLLMEDLDLMIEGLDSIDSIQTLEDLKYKQGQLVILKRIRNMATTMEAAYQDLQEEAL